MIQVNGYTFEKDKFSCDKFNKEKTTTVSSLRIKEYPVQIEAHVARHHYSKYDSAAPVRTPYRNAHWSRHRHVLS